jgi:hypothetical protein
MPGPRCSNEGQRENELREGKEDIGDAHQYGIDPAAGITGDSTDQKADRRGDDGDQQHHIKSEAGAIDQTRENIAALIVGAEQIAGCSRRQQAGIGQIADNRRMRRQHIGQRCNDEAIR